MSFYKRQKLAFYVSVIRSLFEHCSIIWMSVGANRISNIDAISMRAITWIQGRIFDHYSDEEFFQKKRTRYSSNQIQVYF